jgi:hypothetical protein
MVLPGSRLPISTDWARKPGRLGEGVEVEAAGAAILAWGWCGWVVPAVEMI